MLGAYLCPKRIIEPQGPCHRQGDIRGTFRKSIPFFHDKAEVLRSPSQVREPEVLVVGQIARCVFRKHLNADSGAT